MLTDFFCTKKRLSTHIKFRGNRIFRLKNFRGNRIFFIYLSHFQIFLYLCTKYTEKEYGT